MKQKNHSAVAWIIAVLIISLACACPGFPKEITEAIGGVETVQSVLTEMPVDELLSTAGALATEMPVEDIMGTMEAMSTGMPISPEDIAKTAAAGGLPIPLPGQEESGKPQDIPVTKETNNDLIATKDMVTYTTPLELGIVTNFYKTEMPNNGWQPSDTEPIITPQSAVLIFEKPKREATISLYITNNNTGVSIIITQK